MFSDSAEAVVATYKALVGSRGRAAIFSFNGNKIITTSGGIIISRDIALIDAHDPAPHYEHSTLGYNYGMSKHLRRNWLGSARPIYPTVSPVDGRSSIDTAGQLGNLAGIKFMPEAPYGNDCPGVERRRAQEYSF